MMLAGGAGAQPETPILGPGVPGMCFPSTGSPPWQTGMAVPSGATEELLAEQVRNVQVLLQVADEHQITTNGKIAMLITAWVESYVLTDLSGFYGWPPDHTSVGIFQQQDWWGTVSQRMDPATSATLFLTGKPGIPGLLSLDYDSMDPAVAAQEIQRSAHPDRYRQYVGVAEQVLACGSGDTIVLPPGAVGTMLEYAQSHIGKPYVLGASGPNAFDCSGLTGTAMATIGIMAPRTAHQQYEWCRGGAGTAIPLGQEQPGDLFFFNTYLGPFLVGHTGFVWNPVGQRSLEAVMPRVGHYSYDYATGNNIFAIYRLGATP